MPIDYSKAFDCFIKAADEENPDTFFCVGNCYLNGLGVDKNEKAAADWFKKAAEMGEPDAMFHLAWMYQEGVGVEKTMNYRLIILIKQQNPDGNLQLKL